MWSSSPDQLARAAALCLEYLNSVDIALSVEKTQLMAVGSAPRSLPLGSSQVEAKDSIVVLGMTFRAKGDHSVDGDVMAAEVCADLKQLAKLPMKLQAKLSVIVSILAPAWYYCPWAHIPMKLDLHNIRVQKHAHASSHGGTRLSQSPDLPCLLLQRAQNGPLDGTLLGAVAVSAIMPWSFCVG